MFADGQETIKKAKILLVVAIMTAAFSLIAFLIPGKN
jgi:hypothetical protein